MKKLLAAIMALLVTASWPAYAGDSTWLTDLPAAQAQAKVEHKIVLMDFTGSDWCPDCIEFRKKVLDTGEFKAYAAKNIVEVMVDFPDKKAQTADLKRTNAALKDKYNVAGFPTLIVLDEGGREIGRLAGPQDGRPKDFIARLEKFKSGK